MSRVSASYKKQDGVLSISKDNRTVLWAPSAPPNAPPTVTVAVADISNLQQTPATSARVSIKIVTSPDSYVFVFTSPTARDDQAAITNTLRSAIEAHKARSTAVQNAPTPQPNADAPAQSAAMTFAKAVSGAPTTDKAEENMYDDARLLADVELQRSLLSKDMNTRRRFEEALKGKPDSITVSQFSSQFWSTRVHLLRAHAVQINQTHGPVNALSSIKLKYRDNGTPQTTLTRGQIATIFNQHPLVRKAYNDLVPPMGEVEFFAAFFASRLYKRLKGEKITDMDPTNPKFDRYLNDTEENERAKGLIVEQFPHFLDIEGNEQNHSQRQGNAPDMTMRPSTHDKVPILRSLNRVSGHMMADVMPVDADPHAPAGMDEATYEQLRLRDLSNRAKDNRIMLNIRDQRQFFARDDQASKEAQIYSKHNPSDVLKKLRRELDPESMHTGGSGIKLQAIINVDDNSDSDQDAKKSASQRVGTKAARNAATLQIFGAIKQRRAQTADFSTPLGTFATVPAQSIGLSDKTTDSLSLVHSTTIEFLHYFWTVFHSGDPARAEELSTLVETLDKSLERIQAVATEAEAERKKRIDEARKANEAYTARTGKRRRFDERAFGGGAEAVQKVVGPTVEAVVRATTVYRDTLKQQIAALQAQAPGAGTPAAVGQ
ncbi:hypothetical protein HDK77DRAFT_174817 [Phyllosticta capitalensis]